MGSARVQRLCWSFMRRLTMKPDRWQSLVSANGIVVFVGPNGSGKSLLAVEALLPVLAGQEWSCSDLTHLHNRPVKDHARDCGVCVTVKGEESLCETATALLSEHGTGVRLVYSTLPLLDAETGREHPLYRPLTRIPQLVSVEHAHVLFDEVAGVSDAADSATMPAALRRWLQQLRKRDCLLFVTTPAYDRCSKPIRQVAKLVVDVRSYCEEESETGRLWRPRRAMIARAYDAFAFANFNKNTGERQKTMGTLFYWRADARAAQSYDTLAQVHALIDVEEGGACSVCNGARAKPACGCGPEIYDVPYDELEIVTETGPRGGRVRRAVPITAGT